MKDYEFRQSFMFFAIFYIPWNSWCTTIWCRSLVLLWGPWEQMGLSHWGNYLLDHLKKQIYRRSLRNTLLLWNALPTHFLDLFHDQPFGVSAVKFRSFLSILGVFVIWALTIVLDFANWWQLYRIIFYFKVKDLIDFQFNFRPILVMIFV